MELYVGVAIAIAAMLFFSLRDKINRIESKLDKLVENIEPSGSEEDSDNIKSDKDKTEEDKAEEDIKKLMDDRIC